MGSREVIDRTRRQNIQDEIDEIDAELMRRANRYLGGGYQPEIQQEAKEIPEKGEVQQEAAEIEEKCEVMHNDNLLIVALNKYNTDGKKTQYIQINHIVGKLTANKNVTEYHLVKVEFEFGTDMKILTSNTGIDQELTRVRSITRREDRKTQTDG